MKLSFFSLCIMSFMTCSLEAMEECAHEESQETELSIGEAEHRFLGYFNDGVEKYKPLQDALALRPRTIQETVTLLHGILGSLNFYRPQEFSFNGKSFAIYSNKEWHTLNDTGANPLYEFFNYSVGTICDSHEDVKALISLARKQFWAKNKNKITNYLDLLEELPEPVKKRILQRYIFSELDEWVKKTEKVHIETILKFPGDFKIDSTTTIENLKERLNDSEGIPLDQQELRAQRKGNIWALWFNSEMSKPLENDRFVKEVMNTFKTDTFLLTLYLRKPNQNN